MLRSWTNGPRIGCSLTLNWNKWNVKNIKAILLLFPFILEIAEDLIICPQTPKNTKDVETDGPDLCARYLTFEKVNLALNEHFKITSIRFTSGVWYSKNPMYKNLKFKNLSGWNFYLKHPSHKNHFRLKFQSRFLFSKVQ